MKIPWSWFRHAWQSCALKGIHRSWTFCRSKGISRLTWSRLFPVFQSLWWTFPLPHAQFPYTKEAHSWILALFKHFLEFSWRQSACWEVLRSWLQFGGRSSLFWWREPSSFRTECRYSNRRNGFFLGKGWKCHTCFGLSDRLCSTARYWRFHRRSQAFQSI